MKIPETKHFTKAGDPKIPCTCCREGGLGIGALIFLEHIKEHYDGASVIIHSAGRCKKYNRVVGGSKNSEHIFDEEEPLVDTVDFHVEGITSTALCKYINTLPYAKLMGVGKYKKFVHADFRGFYVRWVGDY